MLGGRARPTGNEVTVSQVPEALDGAALLSWAESCCAGLETRRSEIDALNVFPIADSDTGTNLLATMRAALAAAVADRDAQAGPTGSAPAVSRDHLLPASRSGDEPWPDGRAPEPGPPMLAGHDDGRAGAVAKALARGATAGARGNSGIILSQVLRGIAEAAVDGPLTGQRLRVALRRAAVLVRQGLSAPVEGTILTVLDRAAVAADECDDSSLEWVAKSAADGAARALNETPAQLGVLRAAGVVDAGARGLLVLLDCLVAVVCGAAPERHTYARERADGPTPAPTVERRHGQSISTSERGRGGGQLPGSLGAHRGGTDARHDADALLGGFDLGERARVCGDHDKALERCDEPRRVDDGSSTDKDESPRGRGGVRADRDGLRDDEDRGRGADPHFEVMYVISGTDDTGAGLLRERLAVLGDSVVVVGDGDATWSAHVHCRDAGAAIEAGLAVGALSAIRIESFAVTAHNGVGHHAGSAARRVVSQGGGAAGSPTPAVPGITEDPSGAVSADGALPDSPTGAVPSSGRFSSQGGDVTQDADLTHRGGTSAPIDPSSAGRTTPSTDALADRGVVAVVAGAEAAELFEDAGAVVLREDEAFDADTLLRAIRGMPHREVLVLPNGALPAQELVAVGVAARDGSRDVLLLPSASMVQGLAALAVHDRGRIAVDDAFAMSEAAATTRWGALRAARVRALTMVGTCSPGDGLGLVGEDVVVIDPDVVGAGRILLDRMLGLGGELVTLLMGAGAGHELGRILADHVRAGFPGVDVVVYSGGQQADLVQIGVE
ncbi:DAK2 domain-containing protein [Nocardia caishijiensis]|uniref:DAK2 domain-containing protein n=1 Tax=Nocardia caishijiensis TaxID=184756 RepID=UPI001F393D1A|nr:DAK2 domain-containing protein [Nocardia caishijiensis]